MPVRALVDRGAFLVNFACYLCSAGQEPSVTLSGPVRLSWTTTYNSAGSSDDVPVAITVDKAGNIYVTGKSASGTNGDDYLTIRYGPSGNLIWLARYDSASHGDDVPVGVGVDNVGNVYVSGHSKGFGPATDYATIKYDRDGNELWVARSSDNVIANAYAWGMAVDAVGNVYVTGDSSGLNTRSDYLTIKYDTNGKQLWSARYDGPSHLDDIPLAIKVDQAGNVYVTGQSVGTTTFDYLTVKYDPNGNELWSARYDGPDHDTDGAIDLALDSNGNVIVTGASRSISGVDLRNDTFDFATLKYDPNGNQLWVARYGDLDFLDEGGNAISLDAAGNVYVVGGVRDRSRSFGDSDLGWATIKYGPRGNRLWIASNTLGGEAKTLAVDNLGAVYVTGSTHFATYQLGVATIKYDANGKQIWMAKYDPVPFPARDNAYSIFGAAGMAVDAIGNVYVAGEIIQPGTASIDFLVTKSIQSWIDPLANAGFYIQLPAAPGQKNRIQSTTDLKTWIDIGTNAVPSTGVIQFQDTTTAGVPNRFYRVLPLP